MSEIPLVFGRYEFLIRRLHSLTGLLPVGAFLVVHLLTNATVLDGTYQKNVDLIHSLGPWSLETVEWTFIFIPLIFHSIIGMFIVFGGSNNIGSYPYRENFRYSLQRWTGVIAFIFIFWHVFHMRGWINSPWWLEHVTRPLGGGKFEANKCAVESATAAIQASAWVAAIYAVGILATVYHFANGLWTMGITWGVWTSPHAQRWATIVCSLIGLALAAAGLGSLAGFWFGHPNHS
jgi:succinate dehydrogenase / fumarate reductase cytochrome b subunit